MHAVMMWSVVLTYCCHSLYSMSLLSSSSSSSAFILTLLMTVTYSTCITYGPVPSVGCTTSHFSPTLWHHEKYNFMFKLVVFTKRDFNELSVRIVMYYVQWIHELGKSGLCVCVCVCVCAGLYRTSCNSEHSSLADAYCPRENNKCMTTWQATPHYIT